MFQTTFIIYGDTFETNSNRMPSNNCIFDGFDTTAESAVQSFYNLIEVLFSCKK